MAVAKEKPKEKQKDQEQALVRVFRETRTELRKVVWPTREETIRLTLLVIAVSSAVGLFLFVGDAIFDSLYGQLLRLVQ
jgi:preprotein translocase subunit SecE